MPEGFEKIYLTMPTNARVSDDCVQGRLNVVFLLVYRERYRRTGSRINSYSSSYVSLLNMRVIVVIRGRFPGVATGEGQLRCRPSPRQATGFSQTRTSRADWLAMRRQSV